MVNKALVYVGIAIVVLLGIFLVVGGGGDNGSNTNEIPSVQSEPVGAWASIELKDVNTQETFRVSDFTDRPLLIESFAVWCPTCTRQQREVKELHEEIGDSVISISVDTDPNEDEARVLQHTEDNGFDWRYVVSPVPFTQALIDQFGIGIVNAPRAPMLLVCNQDGQQLTRQLDSGVKSVSELKQELAQGC